MLAYIYMSFTNNVYGGVPQNEMVFTTSNVSSDNASFINLSVSDSATITNLTTINWSQPNLNASTVVTDTLVVTNTSAVNLDVSGVMNVSDLNISDLNVSDISVSTLSVGDIVIDEAEVTTLRFDDVSNANYSEIQRDNDTLTIAGGYVNGVGTQFNGDIAFTPYNLSNFTPPSMVVQASDGKVYIPNMSALDINTSTITATTIVNTNQITATGVGLFKSTLAVMNPISQTQNLFWNSTLFQFGNLASVDFNIGNDASNPNKGIIVRGGTNSSVEIPILTSDNFSSALSNISTLNVSTIIVDTDIAVPDINTSQLNASNISVDVNLRVFGITQTDTLEADTITAGCDMTNTLETSTNMYYPNNLLIDYSAPQVATTIELSSNLSLNGVELLPDLITLADPTFSMLSGTAQITNANISTLNVSDLTVDTSFSIPDLNVSNLSVDQNVSIGGDIVEVGNITSAGNLEFFNISAINEIETDNIIANTATFNGNINLPTGTMFGNAVGSVGNFTSIGGGSILSTVRIEGPLANISIMNASDITAQDLHVSGGIFTSDNATVFGNTSTATLTCDLTPNLTAGTGITITSVGGKPTISALGGGVADPLNLSQLNASNISVDGDIELIGTSNISANATTATVFQVISENISVSNDITCSNLTRSSALESVGNTSVGFDLSVGNDATITRDLQVQRFLDRGKPTFVMLRRSNNFTLGGGGQPAIFNQNTSAQVNGEFSTSSGSDIIVATGGWYRVSWALGFLRVSNTGGDRIAVRSYSQKRTAGGGFTFDSFKNTISSSCYIRRNNQCREGHISGYNFLYIPASGAVRIIMECMVEGASTWTSNFNGMQQRASSNFMVEFVSSAAET
jgi:hypothetical protein